MLGPDLTVPRFCCSCNGCHDRDRGGEDRRRRNDVVSEIIMGIFNGVIFNWGNLKRKDRLSGQRTESSPEA